MNHCMIDIETLDASPTAVILSIGAVQFDPVSGTSDNEFYTLISIKDCAENGLTSSQSTIDWWKAQSSEAQSVIAECSRTQTTLREGLSDFSRFFCENKLKYVWANSPSFDAVVMRNAYDCLRMNAPWKYWDELCYRTVKTLNPGIPELSDRLVYHNALDDAKHQVKHLQKIFRQDTTGE